MQASVDYGENAQKSRRTSATAPSDSERCAFNHIRPEQGIEYMREIGRGEGRVILTGC